MGIIYLIQPAELVGTNRYKIGCSSKNTNERIKCGYRKGTRIILIYNCNKHYCIERKIKNCFTQKYSRIAGNEYFQGDEHDIILTFKQVIHDCCVSIDDGITLRVDNSDKTIECCSYNNDVSYNKPIDPVKPNDKKDRFHCEKCQYSTHKTSSWKKHINTKKHERLTNPNSVNKKIHICVCGKEYKHAPTLCTRKKNCFIFKNTHDIKNIVINNNDISYNKNTDQNQSNNMYRFYCEKCQYGTHKKSHWEKHINTKKHFRHTNPNMVNKKRHICVCGKEYKHASTLCAHKKKCTKYQNSSTQEIPSTKDDDIINIMKDLIQKNNQLEDMLLKYSIPTS
jgi:hypothetical protein